MLSLGLTAQAAPPAPPSAPSPSPGTPQGTAAQAPSQNALPLRARLDRDAIRAAIAGLPDETEPDPRRYVAGAISDTISATPYHTFSQDFAKARLPDCLHSEGLKNQPTFFLSGVLALPFIGVAKLRGVCR